MKEPNSRRERTVMSVNGLSVPIPAQVTLLAINTNLTVEVESHIPSVEPSAEPIYGIAESKLKRCLLSDVAPGQRDEHPILAAQGIEQGAAHV